MSDNETWTGKAKVACFLFFVGFVFPPIWIAGFFLHKTQNNKQYFWALMNISACALLFFMLYTVAWLSWIFLMYFSTFNVTKGQEERKYYVQFMINDAAGKAHNIEPGEYCAIAYGVIMVIILGFEAVRYLMRFIKLRKG
ncbi:hypothetical protein ABK040_006436 [Willaertia magna]